MESNGGDVLQATPFDKAVAIEPGEICVEDRFHVQGVMPRLLRNSPSKCSSEDGKSEDGARAGKTQGSNCILFSQASCTDPQGNVEGTSPDPASEVASRCARMVVFFGFCQGVQAFMSYDGGATPASLDTIQEEMDNSWTPAEFGMLGSTDKIGMTVTSIIWGRALQTCGAKPLLIMGLLINALCTFAFGSLRSKGFMYAAKFLMGSTQSLQGVWSTVWTVAMAPPKNKTMWLGLGAVSAGIGNGIGTAVAGFGTANGLPYAFAFQLQAAVLTSLWAGLCFVPWRHLRTRLPVGGGESADMGALDGIEAVPALSSQQVSVSAQMEQLWQNKVFCFTALQISLIMFEVAGIQYIWVRVFVQLWGLSKNYVTLMYLIVAGVGGGVGVAFGPAYIDRKGGYGTMPGIVRSLALLQQLAFGAAVSGALGTACLYGKLKSENTSGGWGDAWLYFTWFLVGAIHALHNGSVAGLCGINVEVIAPEVRTFASGVELTVRNILGFACGPLLPGLVMQLIDNWEGWSRQEEPNNEKWQLYGALAFILVMNLSGIVILRRGKKAASRQLIAQQSDALDALREAFKAQDLGALERAVVRARVVELHRTDGEAVLGVANQLIGACHAKKGCLEEAFQHSVVFSSTPEQLQTRVIELEHELAKLRASLSESERQLSKGERRLEDSRSANAGSMQTLVEHDEACSRNEDAQ